jgi:hypothetical protein
MMNYFFSVKLGVIRWQYNKQYFNFPINQASKLNKAALQT